MKFVYEKALTREDAVRELRAHWKPEVASELVCLPDALGRVTVSDVVADVSLPVYRSSKCDGIAVRSSAWADGDPDTAGWVRDVDWAQADTGDDFPDEFDAVVSAEQVLCREAGNLVIEKGIDVKPGTCVNQAGSLVKKGDLVVEAGTFLTPELLCAMATAGMYQIPVARRPRVGFIPTGSELVACGSVPRRGENIESNSLMVAAFLEQWGAEAVVYPIVRDDRAALERTLDEALAACDIVLINGGSSRGEEDFNSVLISERASWFSHGIRSVPGRPVGIAVIRNKPVVNVPGPCIAAWLAMNWLVRDMVAYALGMRTHRRPSVRARLGFTIGQNPKMERFVRVRLARAEDGALVASQLPKDWGAPVTLARTDGMWAMPAGTGEFAEGTEVEVELLRPIEDVLGA